MDISSLVAENKRRRDEIFSDYNPVTGEGCYDFAHRVLVEIPDFFIPRQWVHPETANTLLYSAVMSFGSIKRFITDSWNKEYTPELHNLVTFELCKARFQEDPEFALFMTDNIMDKKSGEMIPFRLNYPQRKMLCMLERKRRAGEYIGLIILKARQWGGSTLSQLYIKWMQDFKHDGWNAVVLAQAKGTAKKIKAMYRLALEHQPGWTVGRPGKRLQFSPFENSQDDFIVSDGIEKVKKNTLTIASYDNYDSVRGSNFHCAHYSEVAYWKKTQEHNPEEVLASISAGIRNQKDNIEIFESSGRGASGFFYDRCQSAMDKLNNDPCDFLFVPCFIIENDMEDVPNQEEFAEWLLKWKDSSINPDGYREEGKFFWRMWNMGATFEAINWYRNYRNRFSNHALMATEAPIDPVEAFRTSGNLIFNTYAVSDLQKAYQKDPILQADIVLFGEKGSYMLKNSQVRYVHSPRKGEVKIWAIPNNQVLNVKNRYIVSVDIGGTSKNSDFTVMTVIDRLGMVDGVKGKPAVVARWRGHVRHDRLAWKAAVLARWYDNALLVIESNTADRERDGGTEGDHFGTIIEEIAEYYDNMYVRIPSPESVSSKPIMKFGFQTNKLTKSWIIDNLIAFVEDQLYEEPDAEMYRELNIYERKEDGSMGNIEGANNHDDVLMSTAIGLWVCMNEMDKPVWTTTTERKKKHRLLTEAEI